jgi:hypothetical protein
MFHFLVHYVLYQVMSVAEQIFYCNPFIEERHSHVSKDIRTNQPWMISLVTTVKQSAKVCVKCRITFYKMRKFEIY